MNFLIVEGYKEGALKFSKEANIKGMSIKMESCTKVFNFSVAEMDKDLVDSRIEVRRLIEKGKIDEAIKKINSINPEILDTHAELYFELRRQ